MATGNEPEKSHEKPIGSDYVKRFSYQSTIFEESSDTLLCYYPYPLYRKPDRNLRDCFYQVRGDLFERG